MRELQSVDCGCLLCFREVPSDLPRLGECLGFFCEFGDSMGTVVGIFRLRPDAHRRCADLVAWKTLAWFFAILENS